MSIHQSIADAMPPLSHLECTTCGAHREVGIIARQLKGGWPTCCGHTMRLYTVREVEQR